MKEKWRIASVITVPLIYLLFMLLSTAYLVNETYNPFYIFDFKRGQPWDITKFQK